VCPSVACSVQLKREMSEPYASKVEVVQDLIDRLGLTSCANVQIGGVLSKGISGGQAKRTNIGIALVFEPLVLFLDEPTSGLDSYRYAADNTH
jgi:ATP-binding cassette subfamily G (WHITE) protein 2